MLKTKKKLISLMLCVCLLVTMVAFVGCGKQETAPADDQSSEKEESKAEEPKEEEPASEEKNESDDKIVIGSTANNVGIDSYQTTHDKVFREEAKRLGVEAIQLDATGDPMLQVNQVEDLIQKQVDVIVIWPVNGKAIVPVCRKAKEAGIPVLIANSPIDESGFELVAGYAGPDNVLEGRYAGELMIEALGGKGKVVELMGLPGYVTAMERSQGFREAIEGTDIELIDSQPTDWNREKAQRVMENLLTKYDDIDGVYAADDNIAVGGINALKEAGRLDEVKITSATMFGDGYDAMKRGEIYGTVYQSPVEDAKITVQTAIKLAKGEDIPFKNFFETPKVTIENIDDFERPSW